METQTKKFSAKETALINEANAKAKASGRVIGFPGSAAQTSRSTNGGVSTDGALTHVIPSKPAHGATDKAPHTKRAIVQNKAAERQTDLQAKVDAAKQALDVATKAAAKAPKGATNPDRIQAFKTKAEAELAFVAAKKVLNASLPKSEKAVVVKKTPTTTTRAASKNRTIKPGKTIYPPEKKTWGGYMIGIARASKSTDEAIAAHKAQAKKAGYPETKPLDFKWMNEKGYIILGD